MRVVFIEDVPSVAEAGEIKDVADGYGRNYLLPRKLAVLADARATQIVEAQKKRKARIEAELEEEMGVLAKQIEGLDIVIRAKAGAKDRLYGSITNADIAEELNKSADLEVDKRKIELEKPIHEIGSYEIPIRLTKDIIPKIKLSVIEEEETEGKEKKETKAGRKGTKGKKVTKAEKTTEEAETEKQEETVVEEVEAELQEETEQSG